MKSWFNSLQLREKQFLIAGSTVVAAFMIYLLIWVPFDRNTKKLERQIENNKEIYANMQQMAPRIRALQRNGGKVSRQSSTASLTSLIYQTGQSRLQGAQLKRVEEGQKRTVRVWIEKVAFDDMLIWLETLQKRHGINVDSFVADKQAEAGRVNVRLTLKKS
jgi:general secretion pathway protein M